MADRSRKPIPASPRLPHLAELTIRDFAIIDHLHIEWPPGFIAITGETGAGKSIIIDAVGATLGDRFDSIWLRSGAERGMVESIFWDVGPDTPVSALLAEVGAESEAGEIVLTRDVHAARSVARINGRAAPLATVQQVGERLVDIHSQASHLSLSRVGSHLRILDRFGRLDELRGEMAEAARAVRALRREIEGIESGDRQAQREAVLLRHEVDEIDAAALSADEEEGLQGQRVRLRNAFRLRQLATSAYSALQGSDEGPGASELLGTAISHVEELRSIDSGFANGPEPLIEALDAAEELARVVRHYADAIEEDPVAVEGIEDRLLLIADLKRKYGGSIAEILAYRETCAARLEAVEHSEERVQRLRADEQEGMARAAELATTLSQRRSEAARTLEALVQGEMGDLGMPGARFAVDLAWRPDVGGLVVAHLPERVDFDETGVDRIEFVMSANSGEPPRPLAQIASGGELARFMLALKTALSAVDETPVLVFDELDQGVGGRMGHVVGEKLWRLSGGHQVICITHLPQVAAYADAHYVVSKREVGGRTVTSVERLSDDARQREIALMLGGHADGAGTLQAASELLSGAARWKAAHSA